MSCGVVASSLSNQTTGALSEPVDAMWRYVMHLAVVPWLLWHILTRGVSSDNDGGATVQPANTSAVSTSTPSPVAVQMCVAMTV